MKLVIKRCRQNAKQLLYTVSLLAYFKVSEQRAPVLNNYAVGRGIVSALVRRSAGTGGNYVTFELSTDCRMFT